MDKMESILIVGRGFVACAFVFYCYLLYSCCSQAITDTLKQGTNTNRTSYIFTLRSLRQACDNYSWRWLISIVSFSRSKRTDFGSIPY